MWLSEVRLSGSGAPVAVRIRGDTIAAVRPAPEPEAAERVVSADGAWLTPGLIDGHSHWIWGSDQISWLDLSGITTLHGIRAALRQERARIGRGRWLLAQHAEYTAFGEDGPHREHIDDAAGDGPCYLVMFDLHSALVNTWALSLCGLHELGRPAPVPGVVERDGMRTGHLVEFRAMNLATVRIPARSERQQADDLVRTQAQLNAYGFTGVQMMNGRTREIAIFRELEAREQLRLRIDGCIDVTPDLDADAALAGIAHRGLRGRLWEITGVKFWLDGVIDSGTAWLTRPDDHGQGGAPLWLPPERYAELAGAYAAAGFRVATHAIGDAAVGFALETYAHLPGAARHRVEHLEIASDENLEDLQALPGVSVGVQPQHMLYVSGHRTDNWSRRMSDHRWLDAWRLADIQRACQGRLVLGTDWPAAPADPRLAFHWAVHRRPDPGSPVVGRPDQAISAADVLRGFTSGAAWAAAREHELGQVAVGHKADLAVWAYDPADSAAPALDNRCLATFVGGRVTHTVLDGL